MGFSFYVLYVTKGGLMKLLFILWCPLPWEINLMGQPVPVCVCDCQPPPAHLPGPPALPLTPTTPGTANNSTSFPGALAQGLHSIRHINKDEYFLENRMLFQWILKDKNQSIFLQMIE